METVKDITEKVPNSYKIWAMATGNRDKVAASGYKKKEPGI